MKLTAYLLAPAVVAGSLVLAAGTGRAAVTASQFPPATVRDLIAICAPDQNDPMMTASVNYCHGFAQGAVIVEEAHEEQRRARKLFCLPNPRPATNSEIADFTKWANQDPSRLDQPSIDGMFLYLATKYPCGKGSARR